LEALDLGNEDGVMPTQGRSGKPTTRRYSVEEKAQAVRLVQQLRKELGTEHGTVKRVAVQLGYGVESVRSWVKQADIDAGAKPGVTTAEAERIKKLEQENRELRRTNEILRKASAYFAEAELDRPWK
jgi:transposase